LPSSYLVFEGLYSFRYDVRLISAFKVSKEADVDNFFLQHFHATEGEGHELFVEYRSNQCFKIYGKAIELAIAGIEQLVVSHKHVQFLKS
jgi:hypothetical protein